MEINSQHTSLSIDYSQFNFNPKHQTASEEKTQEQAIRSDRFSLNMEISVGTYNRNGAVQGVNGQKNTGALTYQSMKLEVQKQSFALLMGRMDEEKEKDPLQRLLAYASELAGTNEDPLGLGAYFAANPQDLETVQRGEIPDYFNVENTGQRILDIWMGGIQPGSDNTQFVENAKAMINQAYDEISGMLGGLPGIVEETRDWIMQQLDGLNQIQAAPPTAIA
jgi:hypothetical protein